jgi:hypothetical protein
MAQPISWVRAEPGSAGKPKMSDGAREVPDGTDVQELVVLLAKLLDTAQVLSPSPERTAAFEQIRGFQGRLASLLIGSLNRVHRK